MKPYSYSKQFGTIFIIELAITAIFITSALFFWNNMCPSGFINCLKHPDRSFYDVLYMSILRPLLWTPLTIFNIIVISSYGSFLGFF